VNPGHFFWCPVSDLFVGHTGIGRRFCPGRVLCGSFGRFFGDQAGIEFPPPAEREGFLAFAKTGKVHTTVFAPKAMRAELHLDLHPSRWLVGLAGPTVQVHTIALRAARVKYLFGKCGAGHEPRAAILAAYRRNETPGIQPFFEAAIVRRSQVTAPAVWAG